MTKRIRTVIICIVIWLLILSCIGIWIYSKISKQGEYTLDNDSARVGDAWYVMENHSEGGGLIWRIGDDYTADILFTTKEDDYLKYFRIEKIDALNDENLSAIFSEAYYDNGYLKEQYCVANFNENLQVTHVSRAFRFPQDLVLTGFEATEDVMNITAISKNGQQAYVYQLSASDMIRINTDNKDDVEKLWEEISEVTEFMVRECVLPHYFVQAEYWGGDLHLRYDDSDPGYFAINREAKEFYENRKVSSGQYMRAAGYDATLFILIGFIGSMVIVLCAVIFKERRRVVYAVASLEVFMLLICAGSVLLLMRENRLHDRNEHKIYTYMDAFGVVDGYTLTDLNDENLYNTDDYAVLSSRIRRRIDSMTYITDVLLVNTISGKVVISASGMNKSYVSEIYGSSVMDMMQDVANGDSMAEFDIDDEGRQMTLMAINLAGAGHSGMAMIYESTGESFFAGLLTGLTGNLSFILILFIVGSLVGIAFLLWQSSDLLKLQNALGKLSKGDDEMIDKPAVVGRDMNYMWNSVMEITKNVANNNRLKFLTYEAYFRFAPKSIERILDRQSITEVNSGDISERSGAIACLKVYSSDVSGRQELDCRNTMMEITEECREEFDGIFISHNSDLSKMKFLFLEENPSATAFGCELMLKLKEEQISGITGGGILLHFAPYVYGVAGDARQASIYLSSPENDLLDTYINFFGEMKLGVVATEALLEHENFKGETRYIGFIVPDPEYPDKRIKLYELFDAEAPAVRQIRSAQKPRFEEALRLFYEKDFYFARSRFSEVLKFAPDDELSKWYLFECERYLNDENTAENFVGNLHL